MDSTTRNISRKPLYFVGHLFFWVFIGLSVWFFRERVIFSDACYQAWLVQHTQFFALFHSRFSPAVAQFLPLAGVWAGCNLNTFLVLYSVSVPLIIYGFYLILAHGLKKPLYGAGLALAASVMLTESFYYATSEINQAIAALMAAAGILLVIANKHWWHWLLVGLLVTFAMFLHPLGLVACVYVAGYFMVCHPNLRLYGILILALSLALHFFRSLVLVSAYDAGRMSFSVLKELPNITSYPLFYELNNWLLKDYYLLLVGSVILVLWYIKTKKWLPLVWYLGFLLGFLAIVILTNKDGGEHIQFYLEHHYQIFALVLALPLAFDLLPVLFSKQPNLVVAVLAIILTSRLLTIYGASEKFTAKHLWFDKLYSYTEVFEEEKFIINKNNLEILMKDNSMYWPTAYESAFYYKSTGKTKGKTVVIPDDYYELDPYLPANDMLLGVMGNFKNTDLDKRYVNLSATAYRKLNSSPETMPEPNLVANASLIAEKTELRVKRKHKTVRLPITINSAGGLLQSGLDGPHRTVMYQNIYRISSDASSLVEERATPIEVDINGSYKQLIEINIPQEKGSYYIDLDLFTYPDLWWKKSTRVNLEVR